MRQVSNQQINTFTKASIVNVNYLDADTVGSKSLLKIFLFCILLQMKTTIFIIKNEILLERFILYDFI